MSAHSFFDANAVAGELRSVFCVDVTDAVGQCARCGKIGALGEARVYSFEPGIVIRCAGCENPLLRMVRSENRTWLDVRGLVYLQLRSS